MQKMGKKSLALLYFPALAEALPYLQPNSGTTTFIQAPIDTSLGDGRISQGLLSLKTWHPMWKDTMGEVALLKHSQTWDAIPAQAFQWLQPLQCHSDWNASNAEYRGKVNTNYSNCKWNKKTLHQTQEVYVPETTGIIFWRSHYRFVILSAENHCGCCWRQETLGRGKLGQSSMQGLCSQKQPLSIHGLSKHLGFRELPSHV